MSRGPGCPVDPLGGSPGGQSAMGSEHVVSQGGGPPDNTDVCDPNILRSVLEPAVHRNAT
jgi:hypothetical protein